MFELLQDALFSAIAAIGFATISRVPTRALPWCALIAAAGHSLRFALMQPGVGLHIVGATALASFAVGLLAVICSPRAHTPAEACLFPALLPMIPGMYAYKAFGGLALCILSAQEHIYQHNFYLFTHNALTCLVLLTSMAVCGTLPVFIFKKISFQATR